MKKIEEKAGGLKKRSRDRKRSVTKRVIAIADALRHKEPVGEEKRKREYGELLHVTRQILADTRRVLKEVDGLSRRRRGLVRGLCEHLKTCRIECVAWSINQGTHLRRHDKIAGKDRQSIRTAHRDHL
jgi:hypothetical protein